MADKFPEVDDIVRVDRDLMNEDPRNADWAKMSWDEGPGVRTADQLLELIRNHGMTVEEYLATPGVQLAYEADDHFRGLMDELLARGEK